MGACSTVLYVISEQWASAKKYRDAFEVVAEKMMESTRKYQESSSSGTSQYLDTRPSGEMVSATRPIRRSPSDEANLPLNTSTTQSDAQNDNQALSSDNTNEFLHSRSQFVSYTTTNFQDSRDEVSFHHDAPATMWNIGLELDLNLEYDIYGIEGLLSNEGLDWFTGAVL